MFKFENNSHGLLRWAIKIPLPFVKNNGKPHMNSICPSLISFVQFYHYTFQCYSGATNEKVNIMIALTAIKLIFTFNFCLFE